MTRSLKLTGWMLAASTILATQALASDDAVKLGVVLSLSGPGAVLGTEMRNGVDLAYETLGGKLGGETAELIYKDDQRKPELGKQAAEELTRSEDVDFIIGPSFSNVMMAMHRPVTRTDTILLSPNPAPGPLAGTDCNANYFAVPFQNDQPSEAIGSYLSAQGIENAYIIGPNYQAGRDVLEGFKRTFKGEIVNEVYTPLEQTDFSAELTAIRAAAPKTVMAFYPGGLGIQFVKQYAQAGLKDVAPLYTVFTIENGATLDAIGEAALGVYAATQWTYDLDNAANTDFVTAYKAKYNVLPSAFAAMAYDAVMLIDGSITEAGGMSDVTAVRDAMKTAPFASVRGDFAFGANNHPIQDMYLGVVIQGDDGKFIVSGQGLLAEDMVDAYAAECKM